MTSTRRRRGLAHDQRSGSRRPAARWRWLALPIAAVALGACSSADPVDSPLPGGTRPPSSAATVRAPNGTNMGAPPINAGTGAP
jgi:hypothetical protein